jgi:hypothetical protein
MALPSTYIKVHGIYESPGGREMEYLTYWLPDGGFTFTPDSATSTAGILGQHILDALRPLITASAFVRGAKVYIHDSGHTYTRHVNATLPNVGTADSGDCLPDHVAACVRYESQGDGRSGLGRYFIGCVPEIYSNDNVLTGPGLTAYESFSTTLLAHFTAGMGGPELDIAHYSRKLNALFTIDYMVPHPLLKRQGRRLFRTLL